MEDIREDILKLANKSGISYRKMEKIISKFQTMEAFFGHNSLKYRLNPLDTMKVIKDSDYDFVEEFARSIAYNRDYTDFPQLRRVINIDDDDIEKNSNTDQNLKQIVKLVFYSFTETNLIIYSETRLKELLENDYTPLERDILLSKAILVNGEPTSDGELAKRHGINQKEVREVLKTVSKSLAWYDKKYFMVNDSSWNNKNEVMDAIINSSVIFYPSEGKENIPCNLNLQYIREQIADGNSFIKVESPEKQQRRQEVLKDQHVKEDMAIRKLGFKDGVYSHLREANIDRLSDLLLMDRDKLMNAKNIGEQNVNMIIDKLGGMGLKLKDSNKKRENSVEDIER